MVPFSLLKMVEMIRKLLNDFLLWMIFFFFFWLSATGTTKQVAAFSGVRVGAYPPVMLDWSELKETSAQAFALANSIIRLRKNNELLWPSAFLSGMAMAKDIINLILPIFPNSICQI